MKKAQEVSKLKDHLGYWMRMVSNSISYSFARKLEVTNVTVAEWVILREMYGSQNKTNPSKVAKITGLTRGAVSKLIVRLLDKGLVSSKESTDDRRYQEIQLTTKAFILIPELGKLADENDYYFFSVLSQDEQNQLKELLQKLAERHKIKINPIN